MVSRGSGDAAADLEKEKLVAFVANGSVLPRKSGVSDLPMKDSVPFESPASMERTFVLPHRGRNQGNGGSRGNYPDRWRRISRKIHASGMRCRWAFMIISLEMAGSLC